MRVTDKLIIDAIDFEKGTLLVPAQLIRLEKETALNLIKDEDNIWKNYIGVRAPKLKDWVLSFVLRLKYSRRKGKIKVSNDKKISSKEFDEEIK